MELIPGLANDLARQCLNRVTFEFLQSIRPVCKAWDREISSPEFYRAHITRPVFILADTSGRHGRSEELSNSENGSPRRAKLCFELAIFDPESDSFSYLPRAPPLPEEEVSWYKVSGIIGFGTKIVVILFVVKRASGAELLVNLVYVFDFLTGQWCRGADIPKLGRSVLGLGCDPLRGKILVAGGYAYAVERLRTAFLYDVEKDTWMHLADMDRERFECSVVFHNERLHVISGRSTSQERPFNRMTCAESLDPVTLQWGPIENELLNASASDYHWVMGNGEGDLYQLGQNVTFRPGSIGRWQPVAEMPNKLQERMTCAMMWRDKMLVIGGDRRAYGLDLNTWKWTKHELPYDSLYVGCGIDL